MPPGSTKSPTIVLAVSGSIAAYKAAEVARLLLAAGARVIPVMTRGAQQFLGAMTLSGLCGEKVRDEMFEIRPSPASCTSSWPARRT